MFSGAHIRGLEHSYAECNEIHESLGCDLFCHSYNHWFLRSVQSSGCYTGGGLYQSCGKIARFGCVRHYAMHLDGVNLNCINAHFVVEWGSNMKLYVFAVKPKANTYLEHLIHFDDCVDLEFTTAEICNVI